MPLWSHATPAIRLAFALLLPLTAAACMGPFDLPRNRLVRAAWNGDVETVKQEIAAGADLDSTGDWGDTALHAATFQRNREIVLLLLDAGANPNIQNDGYGATPLMVAASRGELELVRAMLAHGADVRIRSASGTPALWPAVLSRDLALVQMLLAAAPDPGTAECQARRYGALRRAAVIGDLPILALLLAADTSPNDPGAPWVRPPRTFSTWLTGAAERGIEEFPLTPGGTPLLDATRWGHGDAVAQLIRYGADVEARDAHGRTALMMAEHTDPKIAAMLRRAGATH